MSDDLVERLRDCEFMGMPAGRLDYSTAHEAADRIEELEAKLAKAVDALELLHSNLVHAWPSVADLGPVANARTTLAALKGEDDE